MWQPLHQQDFAGEEEQQAYVELRKGFPAAAAKLLTLAVHQLEAVLQGCAEAGCDESNCPLHRGCLVFRPSSTPSTLHEPDAHLKPHPDPQLSVRWLSVLQLATEIQHDSVLRAALSYDRSSEVCIALEVPSTILGPLTRPGAQPEGLQLVGHGKVSLASLGSNLVNWCFREVVGPLEDSCVADIQGTSLPLDPANPRALPAAVAIDGLDPALHHSLPFAPFGDVAGCAASADPAVQTARMCLQRTINRVWQTLDGLHARLVNRVHKIKCRDVWKCMGPACEHCRGAMVFTVAALEGPNGVPAWRWEHNGVVVDSTAPKQYVRGVWRPARDIVRLLGSTDVTLLRTVLQHDRRQGYVQAVHIPLRLVKGMLPSPPTSGLLLWRVCPLVPQAHAGATGHDLLPVAARTHMCALPGCGLAEDRFTGVRMLRCGRCHGDAVFYCTAEHQAEHWRIHRDACVPAPAPAHVLQT